jgi:hypothetical protein
MPGRGHGTLVLFCSFKRLFQNLNEVVRMHQKTLHPHPALSQRERVLK